MGLKEQSIKHLIVGIVNEDPEEITRQVEIKELLSEKGKLGSLMSGLLQEFMRKSRRLRDDLYHRLRRDLYIKVPDISQRPEDIPILFYHTIKKAAEKRSNWKSFNIDFGAYRLLMSPGISWPGNIRDIQALASTVISDIDEKKDDKLIRKEDIHKALKKHPELVDHLRDESPIE